MKTAYITSKHCLRHQMSEGHPEQPARLSAIRAHLHHCGLEQQLDFLSSSPASIEQIERAHDAEHVARVLALAPSQGLAWLDPDTAMNPYSLEAALHAAGAVVQGVDLVMNGQRRRVFCAVRPPGHHAEKHRSLGFCIFNNIAVGAAHALQKWGLQRIAIIDFDVHHGNGTESIVADDPRILFCSSFQHPFYPYTHHADQTRSVSNIELPVGCDGKRFREKVEEYWLPKLHRFKPQLVMMSAGFDAHAQDPLAGLKLLDEDFRWITRQAVQIANQYASGCIVSTLEGGYNLDVLPLSVAAHLEVLDDD